MIADDIHPACHGYLRREDPQPATCVHKGHQPQTTLMPWAQFTKIKDKSVVNSSETYDAYSCKFVCVYYRRIPRGSKVICCVLGIIME
jgi:hypothetical protein